ncbi:hypothetical protein GCM10017044_14930 [Kordiimonas sediminis]|uniref:Ysc84 actin-binding domain-containing protein n=1 Tax=Kordiimonas sediminis TaxID=1735581 RepID=A0A919AS86_9PROT|nr:YSC84-related protein [Kordiimonas sediminis]GHF21023.1 hypothetical protein GCM10017044_14930 [Kordiimonas sediminis]
MFARLLATGLLIISLALPTFASDTKRAKIMEMKQDVIAQLLQEEPGAKKELDNSVGYAVFSNVGVNVIFLSGGGGRGVAINNKTGEKTFMKMASAGVGLGLGVKDFRAVFIFRTQKAFDYFIDKGWDLSAQADAAAQSGDKGGEGSVADNISEEVSVYQITKNGIALQATLQGTKYWKDKKLNSGQ